MSIHKFTMLYQDLKSVLGREEAERIFPEYATLPDKMAPHEQACLATRVMHRMDESLDRDTIVKIRHGHTCKLPKTQKREMMELWQKCNNIDEFLIAYGCMKQQDGTYLMSSASFGLSRCVCPLFYRLNEYQPISITWCECCNGHTANGFLEICGRPIKSEIMESIASGGRACVYKLTVL